MSMAGLLVAMCAINVATLLLLRAAGRAREMSMRYALGAKRSRIVSQLLVEGGLLGVAGAAPDWRLRLVARSLVRLMTNSDPGSEPYSTSIDARVLLFTLGVSLLTSLLFSIAPVFHFLRPDLGNALRQNAGTASKGSQLFRKLAVGVQIALSVMLLGGAGLFVRTLDNLRHQPVGFETANLLTFSLDPTNSGYGEDRTPQIVTSALDAIRRIPGVVSAAATNDPELQGDSSGSSFSLQGYKPGEDENMHFEDSRVTAGYFATLHQPLLAGREFTTSDAKGTAQGGRGQSRSSQTLLRLGAECAGPLLGRRPRRRRQVRYHHRRRGGRREAPDLRTDIGLRHLPALSAGESSHRVSDLRAHHPAARDGRSRDPQDDASARSHAGGRWPAHHGRAGQSQRFRGARACISRHRLLRAGHGSGRRRPLRRARLLPPSSARARSACVWRLGAPRSGVVVLIVREMALIAAIATVVALPSVVGLARLFRSQLYGVTVFDPLHACGRARHHRVSWLLLPRHCPRAAPLPLNPCKHCARSKASLTE